MRPAYKLLGDNQGHINNWYRTIRYSRVPQFNTYLYSLTYEPAVVSNFTIALVRYEYHNVYWTVVDLYNIFLTATFLGKTVTETNVLLVDEHPKGNLDDLMTTVFHTQQLHKLSKVSLFRDMVWAPSRHHNPMLSQRRSIPLAGEFRQAVLSQFNLPVSHTRNCSSLNILVIWRRDYTANPRQSTVSRKIKNENNLLAALTKEFLSRARITDVQLDLLPIKEQLKLISTSDVVLGMHGAAFGFSIFMPPGGAALELFPYYAIPNWHMEYLARWANVTYMKWINNDKLLEDKKNGYTTLPIDKVISFIKDAIFSICLN